MFQYFFLYLHPTSNLNWMKLRKFNVYGAGRHCSQVLGGGKCDDVLYLIIRAAQCSACMYKNR